MSEDVRSAAGSAELARSIWAEIASDLESKKARIYVEIKHYPTPITACDQQFNYLLDEQTKVIGELTRVRQAVDEISTCGNPFEPIDRFLASTKHIEGELRERIQSRLKSIVAES